jgi:hypothetical protein
LPEIGEVKRGKDIGKNPFVKYQWVACDCGKERWVQIILGKPKSKCCRSRDSCVKIIC